MDLLPRAPASPGRKQTVTAQAWIERASRKVNFISRVSLGKGRIYDRSTHTTIRAKALDFNRCHLLELLARPKTRPGAAPVNEQLSMDIGETVIRENVEVARESGEKRS